MYDAMATYTALEMGVPHGAGVGDAPPDGTGVATTIALDPPPAQPDAAANIAPSPTQSSAARGEITA
jgi:hypothetical protein